MPGFRRWVQASRPKTLTAAAAPVLMGIALAVHLERFVLLPALAAMVGALLIQVGTNFANDYYDFMRGGDTGERVGPTRVTQAGLIEPGAVRRAAFATFGLALLVGVYLVVVGGVPILVIGVLSVLCGWAYTAGPFPLAYNGLGDVFVLVFFGPVAVAGTYWVQALEMRPELLLAGFGIGALNTAILVANNLRDLETDRRAGKRTLPVLLGRRAGRIEFAALLLVALVAVPAGVRTCGWGPLCLLALVAAVPAVSALRLVLTRDDPRALMPALPRTAAAAGLYGLLFALGITASAIGS